MYYTCTKDVHKTEVTNFYQLEQLWWEMCNREYGESLTDVKIEGANKEV